MAKGRNRRTQAPPRAAPAVSLKDGSPLKPGAVAPAADKTDKQLADELRGLLAFVVGKMNEIRRRGLDVKFNVVQDPPIIGAYKIEYCNVQRTETL